MCYVETKNLDGETNLKHKVVEKHLNRMDGEVEKGVLICEQANDLIYKFDGTLYVHGRKLA